MSIFNSLGSNYTFRTGHYLLGPSPKKSPELLKRYLQKYYSGKNIYLTYKGRQAINVVIKNLGLPDGSSIAVNGYTCYAVYQAVIAAGLKPVYLDIEKDQLNFTAKRLEEAIKKNPEIKAAMIQNSLGIPCDIKAIKKICDQHGLLLIEDLAHCIGLKYDDGREAGTVGQAAALSFSQDKIIDAVSGGAAVFNIDKQLDESVWRPADTWHRFITHIYPWSTLIIRKTFRVGLGRVLLKGMKTFKLMPGPMSGNADQPQLLPAWHSRLAIRAYENLKLTIEHRQKIAEIYLEILSPKVKIRHQDGSIYLRFPILVPKPLELINFLKQSQIYVGDRWYDAPIAPQQSMDLTDYKSGDCPNAEYVAAHMINLPTHLNVNEAQARQIAGRVNEWLKLV